MTTIPMKNVLHGTIFKHNFRGYLNFYMKMLFRLS
jgi:hypothetical protein